MGNQSQRNQTLSSKQAIKAANRQVHSRMKSWGHVRRSGSSAPPFPENLTIWASGCPHIKKEIDLAARNPIEESIGQLESENITYTLGLILGDFASQQTAPDSTEGDEIQADLDFTSTNPAKNHYMSMGNHDGSYFDAHDTEDWWFKTYVEDATTKSYVYSVLSGSTYDMFAFLVGNVIFIISADKNSVPYPAGRGSTNETNVSGGHPSGTWEAAQMKQFVKWTTAYKDYIIVVGTHHTVRDTTFSSGLGENRILPTNGPSGMSEGGGCLYTIVENIRQINYGDVWVKYLTDTNGLIDVWASSHVHPDEAEATQAGRSMIETAHGGTHFINAAGLSDQHGFDAFKMSRLFDFVAGSSTLTIRRFDHEGTIGVNASTTKTLSTAYLNDDSPAISAIAPTDQANTLAVSAAQVISFVKGGSDYDLVVRTKGTAVTWTPTDGVGYYPMERVAADTYIISVTNGTGMTDDILLEDSTTYHYTTYSFNSNESGPQYNTTSAPTASRASTAEYDPTLFFNLYQSYSQYDEITGDEIVNTLPCYFVLKNVDVTATPSGILWEYGGTGNSAYAIFNSTDSVLRFRGGSVATDDAAVEVEIAYASISEGNHDFVWRFWFAGGKCKLQVWMDGTSQGTATSVDDMTSWNGASSDNGGVGVGVDNVPTGEVVTAYDGTLNRDLLYFIDRQQYLNSYLGDQMDSLAHAWGFYNKRRDFSGNSALVREDALDTTQAVAFTKDEIVDAADIDRFITEESATNAYVKTLYDHIGSLDLTAASDAKDFLWQNITGGAAGQRNMPVLNCIRTQGLTATPSPYDGTNILGFGIVFKSVTTRHLQEY